MRFKLLLPFLFLSVLASAQIKGTVTSKDGNTLPFVNIFIENTYKGTTSNSDGYYELNIAQTGTYTIVFQYLGYKTHKETVTVSTFPFSLDATLLEEDISLNEVVINSEENPANDIIRKTIANKKSLLEKTKAFRANFYSKGFIKIKDLPEKFMGQEIGDLDGSLDSTRSGMIYLSETISKIEYQYPNNLNEHIIASKVSGNDNGFSFNTAMEADFNFYENTLELGAPLVSPISDFAFNYYRYRLEGVFFDDHGNQINKISVTPKRENDRVFSGSLYIVEDQWAIYALELTTTGQQAQIPIADFLTFKQSFSYSEKDSIWALISHSIDFEYGLFGITGNGRFTYVYSDYEFNPVFSKNTFTSEILSFADAANKKDSTYWNTIRPVPLTLEEANDYIKKDSIQTVRKSKVYLDSIDAKNNKFKITDILFGYTYSNSYEKWNLGYSSLIGNISYNTVQGYHAGLNLHFNKNLDDNYSRYYRFGGNLNYGFSDKRLRGTANFTYKFNNIKRQRLTLAAGITTQQFNSNQPILDMVNTVSTLFFEDNYMKLYDKGFVEGAFSQELFNGLYMSSSLSYERRKPLFNTSSYTLLNEPDDVYTSNNPLDETDYENAPFNTHNILKLNANVTINFGQKYLRYPDSKYNIPNRSYPSLSLGYEKGFAASVDDYNFDQFKASLYQGIDFKNKGYLQYVAKAGTFLNADAIAFMDYHHVNGNQTRVGTSNSYLNVFNNLPYYTLSTNNSYFELHAEHDFKGYILGKIPLLNKLNFNLILGAHTYATPDFKPYQEYSIGIDNLGWGKFRFLRLDYVRSYQSGFINDAVIFGIKLL